MKTPEPERETKAEEVAQAPTLDLGAKDNSSQAEVAPVTPKAEVAVKVEAAPMVSAPSADAVSSEPIVQTSMQTGPTMSASSFDTDQLDIPAFLRR